VTFQTHSPLQPSRKPYTRGLDEVFTSYVLQRKTSTGRGGKKGGRPDRLVQPRSRGKTFLPARPIA